MKLFVPLKPGWREEAGVVVVGGGAVTLWVTPLTGLPPVVEPDWAYRRLRAAAPPGMTVLGVEETYSRLGWPVTVMRGELPGGRVMAVLFRFLDAYAVVLVRGSDPEAFLAALPEVREALAEARPDWSGEAAALCQVFGPIEGVPVP